MQLEERQTKVGSNIVFYEVGGAGKPLVLLHGLSGSSRWWQKNIEALSEHFQLFVVDLIGFGRARGQRFSLRKSAYILKEWLELAGMERPHFIGHSMGGYITADLAIKYPDMVNRIVLVDALITGLGRGYFGQGLGLFQAIRYMAPDFLPVLIQDTWRAGPVTMLDAVRDVQIANLSPVLEQLKTPSLIVWGEKDMVMPITIGVKLAELMPQAKYVVIPGAGHNPMWDKPQAFHEAVLDFLLET